MFTKIEKELKKGKCVVVRNKKIIDETITIYPWKKYNGHYAKFVKNPVYENEDSKTYVGGFSKEYIKFCIKKHNWQIVETYYPDFVETAREEARKEEREKIKTELENILDNGKPLGDLIKNLIKNLK